MKLTFKMKVKLSIFVAFAFIIALIIHEDHAGVVLKKFKPSRTLSTETKPKVDSTKKASNHQIMDKDQKKTTTEANREVSSIKNSTSFNNETVVTLETISKDKLLKSSVIYEITENTVLNSNTSKSSRSLSVENGVNRNNSNCSKSLLSSSEKDQNCSTTHFASISNISAEINKTKENSNSDTLVSYEKFSSDSAVSQKEKGQLETVSDNHPAELPRKEIKINIALKQPSKNNIQSLNASQPTVSGHLSNANLRDLEIISKDSSAIQLVTESETLQKEGDNSDSENILINETLKVHKSISDGLEFSAHSEVTKNDSSIMKISNESELLQEKDDSSDSENTLANKTLLNQTGHESTASVGLGFLAHSEVSRNDSSVTQLVNEPKTLQKDDNSVTQIVNESETLQKDDSSISENVSTNETQTGLESIVSAGLDFLAQSEVAKNAAVAMEIFNLSDSSLTDHIIDDSVIDLVLSAQNKLDAETASSEIEDIKNDLIPNNEINESHVNTDETESDINLLPIDKKKCPTPGICVFWFMARNACTNDGECLGSKICCRVRCSKKCIDV